MTVTSRANGDRKLAKGGELERAKASFEDWKNGLTDDEEACRRAGHWIVKHRYQLPGGVMFVIDRSCRRCGFGETVIYQTSTGDRLSGTTNYPTGYQKPPEARAYWEGPVPRSFFLEDEPAPPEIIEWVEARLGA